MSGDARPMLDAREAQPKARVPPIAACDDQDGMDAVAGSEYLDDRIRLRE